MGGPLGPGAGPLVCAGKAKQLRMCIFVLSQSSGPVSDIVGAWSLDQNAIKNYSGVSEEFTSSEVLS